VACIISATSSDKQCALCLFIFFSAVATSSMLMQYAEEKLWQLSSKHFYLADALPVTQSTVLKH